MRITLLFILLVGCSNPPPVEADSFFVQDSLRLKDNPGADYLDSLLLPEKRYEWMNYGRL